MLTVSVTPQLKMLKRWGFEDSADVMTVLTSQGQGKLKVRAFWFISALGPKPKPKPNSSEVRKPAPMVYCCTRP